MTMIRPIAAAALALITTLACTVFTPSQPPTPTVAVTATVTQPPPSATLTTTLAPTPTNLPRFTPQSGIATPIPVTADAQTGGGGAFAFGSTSGTGSVSAGSDSNQAVAPVGVRETATPITSSSAVGAASTAIAPPPALPPVNALTPTVPPSFSSQAEVAVAANRTLIVQYEIEAFAGQVILWAVAPSGVVVWQQPFTESITDEAEIATTESGTYTVYAYTERLSGSYQLGFNTR